MPFYTYDWAASNRSNRYFYDLYGVYPNADTANTAVNTASVSGIQKAPGISLTASTGIVGTCPSCKQYSLQGTYVSTTHTSRGHAEYYDEEMDAAEEFGIADTDYGIVKRADSTPTMQFDMQM